MGESVTSVHVSGDQTADPSLDIEEWVEVLVMQSREVSDPKDEFADVPGDTVLSPGPGGGVAHQVRDCILGEEVAGVQPGVEVVDGEADPGTPEVPIGEEAGGGGVEDVSGKLADLLRKKLLSKEEELRDLDRDHSALLDDVLKFNKEWTERMVEDGQSEGSRRRSRLD